VRTGRCTLCPACCELGIREVSADNWHSEYPITDEAGLCPRGSTLGELMNHPRRILEPLLREGGKLCPTSRDRAVEAILATDKQIIFIVDGNIPFEQLTSAAAWCNAWDRAEICFAVEPAERQLLLGLEASGAEYLPADSLGECDGFVIIGDVFSANPTCARGVFDRRGARPPAPIVVVDPGAGTAAKFATHVVGTAPGAELIALASIAAAAGIDSDAAAGQMPSAQAGGEAIAKCQRLAVLIAAEYGRCEQWAQIGFLAGELAKSRGGGVLPQTVGANALAAIRIGHKVGATSLVAPRRRPRWCFPRRCAAK